MSVFASLVLCEPLPCHERDSNVRLLSGTAHGRPRRAHGRPGRKALQTHEAAFGGDAGHAVAKGVEAVGRAREDAGADDRAVGELGELRWGG